MGWSLFIDRSSKPDDLLMIRWAYCLGMGVKVRALPYACSSSFFARLQYYERNLTRNTNQNLSDVNHWEEHFAVVLCHSSYIACCCTL
jgi:hypothetical protein